MNQIYKCAKKTNIFILLYNFYLSLNKFISYHIATIIADSLLCKSNLLETSSCFHLQHQKNWFSISEYPCQNKFLNVTAALSYENFSKVAVSNLLDKKSDKCSISLHSEAGKLRANSVFILSCTYSFYVLMIFKTDNLVSTKKSNS